MNTQDARPGPKHPLTHHGRQHGLRTLWPWLASLGAAWGFQALVVDQLDPYFLTILVYAGINIALAVSLNLVNGFTGQFSMGHAGFMSVGAYTAAYLTSQAAAHDPALLLSAPGAAATFLGSVLVAGLAASAAGYAVGIPCLRLKGDYLAIVTLGFSEIIRVIILNLDAVGGARGMTGIPGLTSFGWVYSLVVITVFSVVRLVNSAHGRAFLAVREDEIAAEAMGVDATRAKVRAFVIGAFFAGAAGALFAHFLRYINPQAFDFNRSFEIIIMVVLGGMGSITGSVLAAVLLTGLREALRPLQEITRLDFRMVIYSLLLIALMLTRPNGLLGTRELADLFRKGGKTA